jgi:hypothetical protein
MGHGHDDECARGRRAVPGRGPAPTVTVPVPGRGTQVQRTTPGAPRAARGTAPAPTTGTPAPPAPAPAAAVDTGALDEAFDHLAEAQAALFDRRQIGVREVLGNLNEADPPSVSDDLLKSLAVAALGMASGYIATAIAARLVAAAEVALVAAIQTALEDGLKDATTSIANRVMAAGGGPSKATFFASQEEALVVMRQRIREHLASEKRAARTAAQSSPDGAATIEERTQAARRAKAVTDANADLARQAQYRASLSRWLGAVSQGQLGTAQRGGTDLGRAVNPGIFATRAQGVVYIYCGRQPIGEPFAPRAGIELRGATDNVRNNPAVRSTPLRELGVPIIALASLVTPPNGAPISIAFGRNESGEVWANGSQAPAVALAMLARAGNASSPTAAAQLILERDLAGLTLGTTS